MPRIFLAFECLWGEARSDEVFPFAPIEYCELKSPCLSSRSRSSSIKSSSTIAMILVTSVWTLLPPSSRIVRSLKSVFCSSSLMQHSTFSKNFFPRSISSFTLRGSNEFTLSYSLFTVSPSRNSLSPCPSLRSDSTSRKFCRSPLSFIIYCNSSTRLYDSARFYFMLSVNNLWCSVLSVSLSSRVSSPFVISSTLISSCSRALHFLFSSSSLSWTTVIRYWEDKLSSSLLLVKPPVESWLTVSW